VVRKCAKDPGICFGFGRVFVGSISNAGMSDSFGIVQLSGEPGENRGRGKDSVR